MSGTSSNATNSCKSAVSSFGVEPQQEPVTNLNSTCEPTVPNTEFNTLAPYLYEYDECVRNVRDYKQLTRQFMESSGKVTIGPFPSGLELVSVYVSGPSNYKCITDVILLANGLTKGCASNDGQIVIDTGRLNEYTGGDISPGFQKLVQCSYIVNDVSFIETKTTTSTKFAETSVVVQTRDTVDANGECSNLNFIAPGQGFSNVYAINNANVKDDSPDYGKPVTGPDAVSVTPVDTSNCTSSTTTTACD